MGSKPSTLRRSWTSRKNSKTPPSGQLPIPGQAALDPDRVPYDVFSAILFQCIPHLDFIDGPGLSITNGHPIVAASHVCRYWRSVILNTPGLWAALPIRIPSISSRSDQRLWPGKIRKLLGIIRVWIARSGDHPLSIHIANFATDYFDRLRDGELDHDYWWRSESGCLKELVRELKQSSRRWRNVTVAVCIERHTIPLDDLFWISHYDVPLLERSNLARRAKCDTNIPDNSLATAPRLRSLSLNGARGLSAILYPLIRTDWGALTELDTRNVRAYYLCRDTHDQAAQLLKALPGLVRGSFELSERGRVIENLGEPIVLRHLTTLKLAGFPVASGFAAGFIFPALSKLSLTYADSAYDHEEPPDFQGSQELLHCVGGQLSVLEVPSLSVLLGDQGTQVVHNLTILRFGPDETTIKHLTPNADTIFSGLSGCALVPCPNLQEFDADLSTTNDLYHTPDVSEAALINMLAARRLACQAVRHARGAGIRRLRLTLMHPWRREGFVRALAEAGVYPDGLEVYFHSKKFWYDE